MIFCVDGYVNKQLLNTNKQLKMSTYYIKFAENKKDFEATKAKCIADNSIGINFSVFRNLMTDGIREYANRVWDEMEAAGAWKAPPRSRMLRWRQFALIQEMNPGDRVYLMKGFKILGEATIVGPYLYDPRREDHWFPHRRKFENLVMYDEPREAPKRMMSTIHKA